MTVKLHQMRIARNTKFAPLAIAPDMALGRYEAMLRIREIRKSKGVTLAALANATDIPYATLSRYETNETWPPAERLKAIAVALNCKVAELFFDYETTDTSVDQFKSIIAGLSDDQVQAVLQAFRALR